MADAPAEILDQMIAGIIFTIAFLAIIITFTAGCRIA